MSFYDKLKFDAAGLIPAIVQEQKTGRVLMMAWMNRDSLERTVNEGKTVFWSRSRQKYWVKGETSGHAQKVKDIAFDCDGVDPAVMPGTSAPLPGGLSFDEAAGLITGLAQRGRVAGINFAEHYPSLDAHGITALAIVRLIINLLGALQARQP